MCGIVASYGLLEDESLEAFARLAYHTKIRGLHSFGVAKMLNPSGAITWEKRPMFSLFAVIRFVVQQTRVMFHTRYSTSGDWHTTINNQPIVCSGMALVMNGVITMAPPEEWEKLYGVQCSSFNDAEIFLRVMEKGEDHEKFVADMRGSFAGTYFRNGRLYALRNNKRPLWLFDRGQCRFVVSTADIAQRALGLGNQAMVIPPNKEVLVG